MTDDRDSRSTAAAPLTPDRVLDAGALRALAHPIRVRIYDILSQYGAQTASSLAERLGESSGSTSYHLRALAAQDLIREVPDRGTARERWWERPRGSVSFHNPSAMRTPSGRAASQIVLTETLNRRHEQLMAFALGGLDDESEDAWEKAAAITTATARLTAEQLAELVTSVAGVVDEYVRRHRDQTGEGVRPVTIRTDMFPLPE